MVRLNVNRTFKINDYANSFNYMNFHYYLKILNNSHSKITYYVSKKIKNYSATRNHCVDLVKKYEQKKLNYSSLFYEPLGIKNRVLKFIVNRLKIICIV